ncbi:hypothetical protein [Lentzea sp. NPDC055074]
MGAESPQGAGESGSIPNAAAPTAPVSGSGSGSGLTISRVTALVRQIDLPIALTAVGLAALAALATVTAVAATSIVLAVVPE